MLLKGCSSSHFIWSIRGGVVEKVLNMDASKRPSPKFKKLEDIHQHADAECTPLPLAERETKGRNVYAVEENASDIPLKEHSLDELTLSQFKKKLKRKRSRDLESILLKLKEEEEDDSDLSEPLCKFKSKSSKSSRSKRVSANGISPTSSRGTQLATSEISKDLATVNIKVEPSELEYFENNHDLKRGESEPSTNEEQKCENDEVSEMEYFEINHELKRGELKSFTNEEGKCEFNQSLEGEFFEGNHDPKRGEFKSSTNEGKKCENSEVLIDSVGGIKKMEMDSEETIANVNQPPSIISFLANDPFLKDPTSSSFDSSQSQLYLQQTPGQVNNISVVQDSDPTIEDKHDEDMVSKEVKSSISTIEDEHDENMVSTEVKLSISTIKDEHDEDMVSTEVKSSISTVEDERDEDMVSTEVKSSISTIEDEHDEDTVSTEVKSSISTIEDEHDEDMVSREVKLSILTIEDEHDEDMVSKEVKSSISTIEDKHDEDMVPMEVKSSISEENQNSTSVNVNADSNSLISDDISLVSKDICVRLELLPDPENTGSEVKLDYNDQTRVMSEASETRQPERLPLTRKCISPNSQEKLCHAMKSPDSLDDMDHFKCKEKLYFGEQSEDKSSSTKPDVEDNKLNVHPQQATPITQNKDAIGSKHVLKRPRSYKKGSPTKKGIAPKGCLDGPRLCRSLPRLSTGCTSIEGCSENAIAFSQRQMHDIESLASKLMSELNSMKVIVEEKMLYEAYRSTSLKNEADEVKSAIKSATKTEETAKRWLSMMARDCNRFCKIMKLNEDHTTSASGDPALGSTNQEKPIEREKKRISFADEAGGTLCDIKVYQIEQEPSEQEPSLD